MQKFYRKLIILLLAGVNVNSYADYSISPVKVIISKEEKITSVNFKNETDQQKSFQLSVYREITEGKKEKLIEAKDLIVTPAIFRLQGGATQLIRIAIKSNLIREGNKYRLSIKELPSKVLGAGQNVSIVPDFRLPITITDQKIEYQE